jgi:AraC-like DNA-binding protein
MRYQKYPPPPALAGYVRCLWVMEGDAATLDPGSYRLFANSCPELIFHYRNRFYDCTAAGPSTVFPLMHLCGPSPRYREMKADGPFGIVGAFLYPYSIQAFFGYESPECTNEIIETALLTGEGTAEVLERIALADSDEARIGIVAGFLLNLLKKRRHAPEAGMQACIQQIIHAKGAMPVESMARQLDISNRHFERRFLTATGIPPKLFSRISRFQSALRQHTLLPGKRLTALAMDCGYSDQSHFIRDFRAFAGLCPKTYFKESIDDVADSFMKMS